MAIELRKHYETLKTKNEQLTKEKNTLETQFKNIVNQFFIQRKALEVSISKNKKAQDELAELKSKQHEHSEGRRMHGKQIEELEQELQSLKQKSKKDKESIQIELDEKKASWSRQQTEIKELSA